MSDCVLYRFYNQRGVLLYIGLTLSPGQRFRAHRTDKQWWREVAGITLQRYDTYDELARAEIEAIQTESPKYNKAHAIPPELVRTNAHARTLWPDASRFHTEHRNEPITADVVPPPKFTMPPMLMQDSCPICFAGQITKVVTCDYCTTGEMAEGVTEQRYQELFHA